MSIRTSSSRGQTVTSEYPVVEYSSPSRSSPTPSKSTTGHQSTSRHKRAKTATSTGFTTDQQIICALTESRGVSPTVGLTFVNLTTAEAVLCQIVDNQTYVKTLHKLHVFEPTQILIPHGAVYPNKSKLVQVLEANLTIPNATMEAIGRKYWDETAGINYIDSLAFREDVEAIKVAVGGNFFATCCLAAALGYIDETFKINFAFHSMRIKYEPSDGVMMMDLSTVRSLEITQNAVNPQSENCLFGLLKHTLTPMGTRALRSNLLQPLTGKDTIEKRYDAVGELASNEELFTSVRESLKSFEDVDKVLTNIVVENRNETVKYWEQIINDVIFVKQYLALIPGVYDALEGCTSELLVGIRNFCAPGMTRVVRDLINNSLNEDITYQKKPLELRNQRTYAVKSGVNGLLDVARQTYKEANNDAHTLYTSLADSHDLNLSLKFDQARQFYFTIPANDIENGALPAEFVNVFRKRNNVECQTLGLVKINQKIVDSHHEVLKMSLQVVHDLTEAIRGEIAPLFKISESVAMLDLLGSMAHVSTTHDYVRPIICSTFALKDCRHPLRSTIQTEHYVPNDVLAPSTKRLQIITGCNMSGKSTYIRSIALVVIMAQIGCFVPATYASLSIRSQLFARVSVDDSSASGISTFAAEMRETAFILRNIDSKSLVIIDELGRGTSTRDGLAIAIAIAEALVQSGALIWFVTHFHDLATILSERPGVANLHLKSRIQGSERMTMLYEIGLGPVEESHYGLAMARVAGLPDFVLRVAEDAAQKLQAKRQQQRRTSRAVIQARRRKLILGLREQLIQVKEGTRDGEDLRLWLVRLQQEFVTRMSKLDDEIRAAEIAEARDSQSHASREHDSILGSGEEMDVDKADDTNVGEAPHESAHGDANHRNLVLERVPRVAYSNARSAESFPPLAAWSEIVHSPPYRQDQDDPKISMSGAL